LKVLLIGESCTDEYFYGDCRRISPEAPVPVFDYINTTVHPGMASNVKQNLDSFGCSVDFITNDPAHLVKTRYVDARSKQQLLRVDTGNHVDEIFFDDIPPLDQYDVIIFSDYNKGMISWDLANRICNSFDGPIFVDSKKLDLTCFRNSYIKINEFEEKDALALPKNSTLIVTLGKNGARWNNILYPAPVVDVHDVSGAGDVFLATLSVMGTVGNIQDAIKKSVSAASISVQHFGTYKLTNEDVKNLL
tara:strand:+ start:8369 stop:9112 length:744 start_codon:yes stop_codon:yes gene_type:complete